MLWGMKETLTSKQRVKRTFQRQEADRVPIDYSANPEIDHALKAHYGLDVKDNEGLKRALGVDFRSVWVSYKGPVLHAEVPGRQIDYWGIRRAWIEHEAGGYWDYCDWPLREATLEQIEAWPMPAIEDFDFSGVPEACERFKDYCIAAGGAGFPDIINSNGMLRTMEQVLVDLITDDEAGIRLIEKRDNIKYEYIKRTLEAGKGKIDMLWMGEDLGTQIAPILSLELFRKQIRPRMQRYVDLAKRFEIPAMIHCCGSSSWAFDDFIDMGISVVDTLQPEAMNMAPAYLKKRYGHGLAFHGMISTAGPLAYGTVEDVVQTVRSTLNTMMPGGGYALAPTHQIQSNSPVENVVAMYEVGRREGVYK